MISQSELIQIHYEFAMSIGTSLDLRETLGKSLTTILKKMNCPAGGVHFFKKDEDPYQLEKIISIPRHTDHIGAYQKALEYFTSRIAGQPYQSTDFKNLLPLSGRAEGLFFTIVDLPDLGVVLLLTKEAFDSLFVKSLAPILTKLAVACKACLQNAELMQHRSNLQELVSEKTSELVRKNQQLTQEIEHRTRYEEALRENEEKYRELVQNANSIILRWNTEGRVTFFNEYAQSVFGFSEEEIIGRHVVGTIVPETESTGRDLGPLMDDICRNPQAYEYNVNENMRKDGSKLWIAWTNKVMTDDLGDPVGALSIGADISEHKKIEEALAESEKSLKEAQQIARLGNWSWDIVSNTLHWSDETYRILGVQPREFDATYEAFLDFVHPVDRKEVERAVNEALYQEKPYDIAHRIVLKSGEERLVHEWGEATFDQSGKPIRLVGIVQDITEQRRSEQRFKLAAEAMSDIIYEWDMRDDSLAWFGDIDAALGFEAGEFPRTLEAWIERIHPEDLTRLTGAVAHHRTSTDPISYEYRIQCKDGSWVYWSDYGIPVLDTEGKPGRWIGACTNITERKNAEDMIKKNEQLLAETQRIAQLGSWEFDTVTQEIKWSEETFRIAGRQVKDTLTFQKYLDIVHPDDLPLLQNTLEKSEMERASYELELRQQRPDGSYNYTLTRGKPVIKDDQVIKFIGSVLDITERKQSEQALQKAHDDLKYAKNAAEAANRAKSSFLANMSHELRTPLNAILGFSQIIAHSRNLNSEEKENIRIINRSGEHLLALINAVLDMSKIESGQIDLNETDFDLHHFLNEMKNLFQMQADKKGLDIFLERDPGLPRYVRGDETKLHQIFANLLSNAVKFTKRGTVVVSATSTYENTDSAINAVEQLSPTSILRFDVADTGPGIPQDELDRLFDPFIRTKAAQDQHEGTGLGLAISRKFVQIMGGDITVESTEEADGHPGSSIFKFYIPVQIVTGSEIKIEQSTARVIALQPDENACLPHYRILLVDDVFSNRQVLKSLLAPLGFEIREAKSGQEALAVCETWQPHLIWLDVQMPEMSGYEVIRRIKNAAMEHPPIIISVSASAFEEDRQKVVDAGSDGFVGKPFKESEIFEEMRKHLHLNYIYDEHVQEDDSSEEDQEQKLCVESMKGLPSKWKTEMAQAIEHVDLDQMGILIEQVREQDETLAEAIKQRIDQFDYEKVLGALG